MIFENKKPKWNIFAPLTLYYYTIQHTQHINEVRYKDDVNPKKKMNKPEEQNTISYMSTI